MDEQSDKIKRSSYLIKAFMVLVIVMQVIQFYQTDILDFGALAGAIGVLALLRGILLSPQLLAKPLKYWFASNLKFEKASYSYFILAFILIVISFF
ncbi:hypothetical protein [Thalassotalea profundi]|uniref:Uncharacterized protein n=1 Tax=Thalassotalea profundi TaxID=2036687 RepID=A0ABQ3IH89_9GAMM|nr:hypothetical protein [Thalassotalea profundi]GHE77987.1 hypothetical protein GCM10011501_02090 [Thalassotalea profundi]